jgi:ribosomal protein S27AE
MSADAWEARWRVLSDEVLTGVRDWRTAHPRATFAEIEAAVEERLSGLRAQLLQDVALASAAAAWPDTPTAVRPACPDCGTALQSRGPHTRTLTVQGDQAVPLTRTYGVCPACGAGLFPPR